jgi:hypothetical protein
MDESTGPAPQQPPDDTPERGTAERDTPGERGPGAHSGAEQREQQRIVPGTAGAAEGYSSGEGTGAGDPLKGVEADQADVDQVRPSDTEGEPDAGPVERRGPDDS